MRLRFSLAGLMGVVVLVALGIAAIRNANPTVANATYTATVVLLCTASCIALDRKGAWSGFAIFAWAYLLLCTYQPERGPELLTLKLIDRASLFINGGMPNFQTHSSASGYDETSNVTYWADDEGARYIERYDNGPTRILVPLPYRVIARCLMSLVAGGLGAIVGGYVARRPATPGGKTPGEIR